jgi:hypothetical protein
VTLPSDFRRDEISSFMVFMARLDKRLCEPPGQELTVSTSDQAQEKGECATLGWPVSRLFASQKQRCRTFNLCSFNGCPEFGTGSTGKTDKTANLHDVFRNTLD